MVSYNWSTRGGSKEKTLINWIILNHRQLNNHLSEKKVILDREQIPVKIILAVNIFFDSNFYLVLFIQS